MKILEQPVLSQNLLVLIKKMYLLSFRYDEMYTCWHTIPLFRPTAKMMKDKLRYILVGPEDEVHIRNFQM